VHVLVGMFDRDQSGTIELHEFQGLWNYLSQWRALFDRFDRDRSGTIDAGELNTGLLSTLLQQLALMSFVVRNKQANVCVSSTLTHTHTHNHFMAVEFVRDNPGEPVPEETFTHSHLLWSSIVS